MASAASGFNPTSYAALRSTAGAGARPKSEYGLTIESQRRLRPASRVDGDAKATQHLSPRASHTSTPQRWRGGFAGAAQPSPRPGFSGAGRRKEGLRSPSPAGPPTSSVPRHWTPSGSAPAEGRGGELDEASVALLAHLQDAVVDISHHIVAERRCTMQLREEVLSLQAVVAQQEAMLDGLARENDALRAGTDTKQQGGGVRVGAAQRSAASVAVSAAEVDRCVVAEFDRLCGGRYPRGFNPFDRVSPDVATVLRSLAMQVLHQRQQPAEGVGAGERGSQAAGSTGAVSPLQQSPASEARSESLPAAGVTHGGVSRTAASSRGDAGIDNRREEARTTVPFSPLSESSTSVNNGIYEDAASILSDIRARYGL